MDRMSVKENTELLIRGGKPERVGLFDSPWPDTVIKWREQGHFLKKDEQTGEDVNVDPEEFFGFDMRGVGGWFDNLPKLAYKEVLEETDEWEIARNGAGAVFRRWKNKSGTPEHLDFRMTTREVWEKDYRGYLLKPDRERLELEIVRKINGSLEGKDVWKVFGHMFIWETARMSMGDVTMFENLSLDPEWIHDYNRVYTDFYKEHFRILIEEVCKPDGIWIYEDLGYSNGLFCSPKILEELIFPYYKELVDFIHSYDIPVIFHSCGGIEKALPLIVDAKFDALNPMEVKAGCDVRRFAEKYGDKLAFIGGLDARILESGDRALIKKEAEGLIKDMKSLGARYFFGSDHSVSTNVDYDDFVYAIDVYKENMYY